MIFPSGAGLKITGSRGGADCQLGCISASVTAAEAQMPQNDPVNVPRKETRNCFAEAIGSSIPGEKFCILFEPYHTFRVCQI